MADSAPQSLESSRLNAIPYVVAGFSGLPFFHRHAATFPPDFNDANRSVIVSGIKYRGQDLEDKFREFLGDDYGDRVHRLDVRAQYGKIVIYGMT